MGETHIRLDRRAAAAWITLDRPDHLNTVSADLIAQFHAALDSVENDADVRCLVITGAGRAFCAGADLKFVDSFAPAARLESIAEFLRSVDALISRIEMFPKPVIAAINGIAVGAGLEMVLACDLVVAIDEARIGDGHANFGMLPGAGASVRLPRKVGPTRAKYLFFTGDLVAVGDPILAELVNLVVPEGALRDTVDTLVAKIAAKSPLGLKYMKKLANSSFDISLQEALHNEQSTSRAYATSHDHREGIAAFNERRKPRFVGF